MKIDIIQDETKALKVLRHVGQWMRESNLNLSDWWNPEKLSIDFLRPYTQPNEFYVAIVDGRPAACVILQNTQQNMQDWSAVDGDTKPSALYIHYLAVEREFAGKGLSQILLRFADELASKLNLPRLRLDTNADEPKLRKIYENYGYKQVRVVKEDDRNTVLYEKPA